MWSFTEESETSVAPGAVLRNTYFHGGGRGQREQGLAGYARDGEQLWSGRWSLVLSPVPVSCSPLVLLPGSEQAMDHGTPGLKKKISPPPPPNCCRLTNSETKAKDIFWITSGHMRRGPSLVVPPKWKYWLFSRIKSYPNHREWSSTFLYTCN